MIKSLKHVLSSVQNKKSSNKITNILCDQAILLKVHKWKNVAKYFSKFGGKEAEQGRIPELGVGK